MQVVSDKEDAGAEERKPNGSSVTSVPCTCRSLQHAAEEPANPIVFDARMNEYHLTHLDLAGIGRHGYSIVFHCLYCGGAAAKSKRDTFFAHMTDAESRRLRDLASSLKTVEEAVANLRDATTLYLSEFPLPVTGHPFVTMFTVPEPAHA